MFRSTIAAAFAALSLLAAIPATAQMSAPVEAALGSGAVGEQADGYLGFARPPSPELRKEVDAINIKRRQGYTQVAQAKNVPIEAFAASIGCRTLAALKPGRAYNLGGAWAVKGSAPITLPSQCGG
ncbi:MAG TPA: YdbL family protein [Sphingomonas sp.]|nr:YdbL family protein [Sphingomonas sp.]